MVRILISINSRTRRLRTSEHDRLGHVFGVQHAGFSHPLLGSTEDQRKLGFHAAGTDHAYLDTTKIKPYGHG